MEIYVYHGLSCLPPQDLILKTVEEGGFSLYSVLWASPAGISAVWGAQGRT